MSDRLKILGAMCCAATLTTGGFGEARSANKLFQPGDAYFATRLGPKVDLTKEDVTLRYAFLDEKGMDCGYHGFWNLEISIPKITREALSRVRKMLKADQPNKDDRFCWKCPALLVYMAEAELPGITLWNRATSPDLALSPVPELPEHGKTRKTGFMGINEPVQTTGTHVFAVLTHQRFEDYLEGKEGLEYFVVRGGIVTRFETVGDNTLPLKGGGEPAGPEPPPWGMVLAVLALLGIVGAIVLVRSKR